MGDVPGPGEADTFTTGCRMALMCGGRLVMATERSSHTNRRYSRARYVLDVYWYRCVDSRVIL